MRRQKFRSIQVSIISKYDIWSKVCVVYEQSLLHTQEQYWTRNSFTFTPPANNTFSPIVLAVIMSLTTPSPLATSLLRDVLDSESYNEKSPSHITLASPSIERAFDSTVDITPMKRMVEKHRADGTYIWLHYASFIHSFVHLSDSSLKLRILSPV